MNEQIKNIFGYPTGLDIDFAEAAPSSIGDYAPDSLHRRLTPKVTNYCAKHLLAHLDSVPFKDFKVGSAKRFWIIPACSNCDLDADFVLTE